MINISASELRSRLSYDPQTGVFVWKDGRFSGRIAGNLQKSGYLKISIGTEGRYYAHRLAWFYMTGEMPDEVDHKNCQRGDNRWDNLRIANRAQQKANSRIPAHNKSGHKGVYWRKDRSKWAARMTVNGRIICLGDYDDKQDAALAYQQAFRRHYGEYACVA